MPRSSLQPRSSVEDLRLDGHVERGGRLVGDQQRGPHGDAPWRSSRAGAARPRAGADSRRRRAAGVGDARPASSSSIAPPARLGAAERSCALQRLGDLVADRQHRVERRHRLLEDHGDLARRAPRATAGSARPSRSRAVERDRCRHDASRGAAAGRISDSAVIDLPQPDSPTSASVLAASTMDVEAVDRRDRPATRAELRPSARDVDQERAHPARSLRVERVVEPVADQVQRQHRHHDRDAGDGDQVPARCAARRGRRRSCCPTTSRWGRRARGRPARIRSGWRWRP